MIAVMASPPFAPTLQWVGTEHPDGKTYRVWSLDEGSSLLSQSCHFITLTGKEIAIFSQLSLVSQILQLIHSLDYFSLERPSLSPGNCQTPDPHPSASCVMGLQISDELVFLTESPIPWNFSISVAIFVSSMAKTQHKLSWCFHDKRLSLESRLEVVIPSQNLHTRSPSPIYLDHVNNIMTSKPRLVSQEVVLSPVLGAPYFPMRLSNLCCLFCQLFLFYMSKYLFVPTLLHQNIAPWNHTIPQLTICASMKLLL